MADDPENFDSEFDTETFGPSSGPSTGRPEIEIRVGEMQRAVDEAEAALIAAQPSSPVEKKVFRRGDRIVSIAIDKAPTTEAGSSKARSSSRSANTRSPNASRPRRRS